jgi:crotonobetainyl-CoA:carnitine CoA-transferase CaiB-like acyl-CoA transferase
MSDRKSRGPLSELRVLDFTQFLSGPYATQILGDLGADVIKIESVEGDMTRRLPPYFVGSESAYYLSVNRSKRSLALDLKSKSGRDLAGQLALKCNVVVENFRPGVLQKLGLSYADIAAESPGVIWCSISGFGQDGPYRDRPAYDMIVQAMSGGMSLTGEKEGAAVRSGIPLGDIAAGMYGVIGILAALAEKQHTGKGKLIDVSMLDCQIAMLSYQAAYYLASGDVPARQGSSHDSIPTYRSFTCGDGIDIAITANTERMWVNLCDVLGRPELTGDEQFVTNERRYANRVALWGILESAFQEKSAAEWAELLVAAEVPAAVVNTLDRSLNDPHVLYRNMVLTLRGQAGEKLRVAGNPLKLVGEKEPNYLYPPPLGANTQEVLQSVLGCSQDQIAALARAGAFGAKKNPGLPEAHKQRVQS